MPTETPRATGSWQVLPISGDVDLASAPSLREHLTEITEAAPAFVVIDMADLEFIDSTGLGVLVGTLRRVRAAGGDVRLARARTGIARVFAVTGLDRVFSLYPSLDDAMNDQRAPETL